MNNNKLNMSVLALGCGVLSIAIGLMGGFSASSCSLFVMGNACVGGIFGILLQLLGIAAGAAGVFLSLSEQKKAAANGMSTNLALAAMIVSIIGVVVAFIGTICVGVCTCKINEAVGGITSLTRYF